MAICVPPRLTTLWPYRIKNMAQVKVCRSLECAVTSHADLAGEEETVLPTMHHHISWTILKSLYSCKGLACGIHACSNAS